MYFGTSLQSTSMKTAEDLVNRKFGFLTVLAAAGQRKYACGKIEHLWECQCDCGTVKIIAGSNLRQNTKSCGCYRRNKTRKMNHDRGRVLEAEDSCRDHPLYGIWCGMVLRCHDSRNDAYQYYGARGISVCARWRKSFVKFCDDIGARPSSTHSIDRIKNAEGYRPDNVRWATPQEQQNNRRDNAMLPGESIRAAARRLGMSHTTLAQRLKRFPPEIAMALPKQQGKRLTAPDTPSA